MGDMSVLIVSVLINIAIFIGIPLVLLGLVIGCTIVGRSSEKVSGKLGCWLGTVLFSGLPVFLIVNFTPPSKYWIPGGIYGLLELLLLLIIFRRMRKPAVWISYLVIVCVFAAGVGVYSHYQSYVESLATVSEPSNLLWQYDPANENNTLVLLDEPAALTLAEDLPILDGATALYPVYAAFANAVYPKNAVAPPADPEDPWGFSKDSEVLLCSKTTQAYKKLVDGKADIIFVAGPSDEQLQYAADKGEEMVFTPIGRECFVFFVNAQNPVNGLTVEQLRGIYSGQIKNWKELGADIGKIRPFQRDEGSGSQSALVRFMGDTPLMEPETENRVDGMGGIIERTADYRNFSTAIGYSFRFYATEMVQNGEIKLLEINGVAPTKENILNDTYPISDSFYALTLASNDNPNVPVLIDWILSGQGQELIDKTGYVALK